MHHLTGDERYCAMTGDPMSRLIPKMALPSIVSMLITSVYNMADTYFVSQLSTDTSAAVGVIFALMALIQAIGFMLGMGAGNLVSRLLGEKKQSEAETVVSVIFFTALISGAVITAAGLALRPQLIVWLGAIESVQPYAMDYALYIIIGAPVMMGSFVLNNQLRAQGYAVKSMIGIAAGGLLNIALDPILIFGLKMGITGAAVATLISQCVSFTLLIMQTQLSRDVISLRLRRFRPTAHIYIEVMHIGLPSFCRQGMASLSSVVLNRVAGPFGAAALAAMSIVGRFMLFIYSGLIGFAQGFQPVSGFNFGAKRYDRVLQAYYFSLKVALILLSSIGVIVIIFAPQIMTLFRREDAEVILIGTLALRLQCATLPFQAVMIMAQFLTQSIGYGFRASLVAMSRHGIFLIPCYLLLPRLTAAAGSGGILGIQAAQPVSDLCTAALAVVVTASVIKMLKRRVKDTSDGNLEI